MLGDSVMRHPGRGNSSRSRGANRLVGGTVAGRRAIEPNPLFEFLAEDYQPRPGPAHPGLKANFVRFEDVDLFHLSKEPEK